MKLNKKPVDLSIAMDMTPMIDVVFNLIIFFILITDLSQRELEELELPVAQNAVPDRPDPKLVRPVINVDWEGRMIVRREELYDPAQGDSTALERFLADAARQMPQRRERPGAEVLPDNPLLIRADENTEFRHLQRVMELCGKEGIKIWRLELAAAEDPNERAARSASAAGDATTPVRSQRPRRRGRPQPAVA